MSNEKISPYIYPGLKHEYIDGRLHPYLKKEKMTITEEQIFDIVGQDYGLTKEQIISRSRKRECVESRHLIAYILKRKTRFSLAKIGEMVGGKDHTTIIHSVRTFENIFGTDSVFRDRCENVFAKVGIDPKSV
jgi:chromosomal replication initiator protein